MLDTNMINQLKEVFQKLESEVVLSIRPSHHAKQSELKDMLEAVSSTSSRIRLSSASTSSNVPGFSIQTAQQETGISFRGIPGGHEFTSLILAILNSDGKGKLPDQGIQNRIKALNGPIQLKTYMSLSCENCPDVVQALNIMCTLNPGISHEVIDGEFAQDEIDRLKIQGVPTVVCGSEVLSVGKSSLGELLGILEEKFGQEGSLASGDLGEYDVIVIGGGPAGASAAIYSARKGLKTAVIAERIGGQLKETQGIENLISVPYTKGPELAAKLLLHMNEYDIDIFEHRLVESIESSDLKMLVLNSGETIKTRSLIIATGTRWRELGIPGEKEFLGRGVGFCPHCDGPFFKGKDVAVIGGGNSGVEAAIDLAGIVKSVTLFEFMPELKADRVLVQKLHSLSNVTVVDNARTAEIVGDENKMTGILVENRETGEMKTYDLNGVFVQIGITPNSAFVKNLLNTNGMGEIEIDSKCRTSIPGIYAAGDVSTVPFKQIIISMGEGAKAALSAFEDLVLKAA